MSTPEETARLIEIRSISSQLPEEFGLAAEAEGLAITAPGLDGYGHETIARLSPAITFPQQQAMLRMPADYRFLLDLMDRAFRNIRDLRSQLNHYRPEPAEPKKAFDHARDAAMHCQRAAFRRFLAEVHDKRNTDDAERTAVSLRNMLRIESRSELNTDPAARARWQKLKKEFEQWLKLP